jgi:galactose mutarotase-like enzyme
VADQNKPWVQLSSTDLHVEVNPLGAQLSVLRDRAGRDWLWDGNASIWAGRAPILFPTVGEVAGGSYRLGAQSYRLGRHGFARGKLFEVVSTTAAQATFRLKTDPTTLEIYPFPFEFDVRFEVSGPKLSVTASVRNPGSANMPASVGFHPAFRWPLPFGRARAAHFIEFEQDEPAPIRRLTSAGLLSPVPHPTPVVGKRLMLEDALFQPDVVIFDQFRSHRLTYGAQDGPHLEVAYPDATYLGIWTKPGAPFVCIEPWRGIADPEGFAGDFTTKPGVFSVPPGGTESISMTLKLVA